MTLSTISSILAFGKIAERVCERASSVCEIRGTASEWQWSHQHGWKSVPQATIESSSASNAPHKSMPKRFSSIWKSIFSVAHCKKGQCETNRDAAERRDDPVSKVCSAVIRLSFDAWRFAVRMCNRSPIYTRNKRNSWEFVRLKCGQIQRRWIQRSPNTDVWRNRQSMSTERECVLPSWMGCTQPLHSYLWWKWAACWAVRDDVDSFIYLFIMIANCNGQMEHKRGYEKCKCASVCVRCN